ncbi:DUF1822 family protein [Gloeocapsa sp. PCC 73106]|uniref:DUF1822 family protein n=1 Tax=Gloeocapsa sp. PCC 73106 TaxID=102232 RepID=UPI0002ABBDCF|nr:DUF1822 family protein [Gloeocapsa sp. PCC 73106]ELR99798.1 Protein of unknown function (DUF1822) [Gloeocapsa sp. PCC 73106]
MLDIDLLSPETVFLDAQQIEQQAQKSNSCAPGEDPWQAYLNCLALCGFKFWLNQRSPDLVLDASECQINLNAIFQLKISGFRVCLLSQGIGENQRISLPVKAIENAKNKSHFYIIVGVNEESEQVSIMKFSRYDQLQKIIKSANSTIELDQTYSIPVTVFDSDIDHLLLYLRCLEPSAIFLTESLTPLFRVSSWLKGELEQLAESLSWVLLPTPGLALDAFRSVSAFDVVLRELQEQGISIPPTARGISKQERYGNTTLDLYAYSWLLPDSLEWLLLFVVSAGKGEVLPEQLRLQVADYREILSEQEVYLSNNYRYLYVIIAGEPEEEFTVSITLSGYEILKLPAFTL